MRILTASGFCVVFVSIWLSAVAFAQADQNEAMNAPDKLAWTLFLEVNADAKTAGNNNALFETWASDGDTFLPSPAWPTTPTPLALHPRALSLAIHPKGVHGGLLPLVVPGENQTEETRRNKPAFTFIVEHNLYKISGLAAAFRAGTTLSFPPDSLEVKVNWVEVGALKAFNGFSGTPADAAKIYHVNSAGGKQFALVSMHVISNLVPNWTWATFEHKDNPGRCDVMGCRDAFGALTSFVPPQSSGESTLGGGAPNHYPDCAKTDALKALFAAAKIDPAYANYCLKGSQTDFADAAGLPIRVGNSVTEQGFVAHSSCMSCHGRAGFDKNGHATTFAGFNPIESGGDGPIGPIDPSYYFTPTTSAARDTELVRYVLGADFIWSVPFCALDDTATPAPTD
jgi:hypothetical protein